MAVMLYGLLSDRLWRAVVCNYSGPWLPWFPGRQTRDDDPNRRLIA